MTLDMTTPPIVMAVQDRVKRRGSADCLVVMNPATYQALVRWAQQWSGPLTEMGNATGNKISGVPVEVNGDWVGDPQLLEPHEIEKYRSARRSRDLRSNPDWRLKT